jgi:hypothetical protein
VLAWLNDERAPVPMEQGLIAGGLDAGCVLLGVSSADGREEEGWLI